MNTYKIAIIPGDGVGPEVTREGIKVLDAAAAKYNFKLQKEMFDFGGERYLRTGETLSDSDISHLKQFHAIYLGAVGHPDVKPGILERGILLKLRFDLNLYVNLRPVKLYKNVETPIKNKSPEDINYCVFRENIGGLYTGKGSFNGDDKKGTSEEIAIQEMIYSRHDVEQCVRFAFQSIKAIHCDQPWRGLTKEELSRGFTGKLTLCGKTNVLTFVYDLWERTFHEVAKEYPEILTDYCHVDAICIYMIESPERFDGIVTGNMFGDIITDLAAVTQGGMGVAPSGNINPEGVSMFEPVHGSAPQFTGKNVINPIAAIATAHMLLAFLGELDAAESVESAIGNVTAKMKSMLAGRMGYSTSQIGDMVVKNL